MPTVLVPNELQNKQKKIKHQPVMLNQTDVLHAGCLINKFCFLRMLDLKICCIGSSRNTSPLLVMLPQTITTFLSGNYKREWSWSFKCSGYLSMVSRCLAPHWSSRFNRSTESPWQTCTLFMCRSFLQSSSYLECFR